LDKAVLTERGAAKRLGISRGALRKYKERGLIGVVTVELPVRNALFYFVTEVDKFAKTYRVRQGRRIAIRIED